MVTSIRTYRDRIFIVKDMIFKLTEYGQLSRTDLYIYCQLNLKSQHSILDELESNRLVNTTKIMRGKKLIKTYAVTSEGISFYQNILAPYEKLFPRDRR
jgi:predicted transcriptional regulator